MLSRNARLHLQRVQNVRLSPKRRTLAVALNRKSNDFLSSFDRPPHRVSWSISPTGLFGQPSLVSPSSFQNLAVATLIRAKLLTERIVRARESRDELFKVVKNLDRLSDMLCSVIDLAELVRNAHPDPEWVESANEAYEQLCEYMNVLNTNVGLYEVCLLLAFIHSVLIQCRVGLVDSKRGSVRPHNCPHSRSRGTSNRADILAGL
jgi:intermediate peptidase